MTTQEMPHTPVHGPGTPGTADSAGSADRPVLMGEPVPTGRPVLTGEPVPTGSVFDIQRFSLYDGPGIRTTVFLKGCPLCCPWCHNPEGIAPEPELLFNPDQCVLCGACVAVCPSGAHSIMPSGVSDGIHDLDRDACVVCGACAPVCPSRALALCGQDCTVDDVMAIVLRDRGYYADSGGGLTLSGGEPLRQPAFTLALLTQAKASGLHTAVETSGFAAWQHMEAICSVTDLFLFDIKETDPVRHKAITGVPLQPILDNLRRLAGTGAPIVLRLPFIPGVNDRADHIETVARLAHSLPTVAGVDLLPYHRLGKGKRALLGRNDNEVSRPPAPDIVQRWKAQFADAGLVVQLAGDL